MSRRSPSTSPCLCPLRPPLVPAVRRDAIDMSLLRLYPAPLYVFHSSEDVHLIAGDTARVYLSSAGADEQRACTSTGISSQCITQAQITAPDLRSGILTQWGVDSPQYQGPRNNLHSEWSLSGPQWKNLRNTSAVETLMGREGTKKRTLQLRSIAPVWFTRSYIAQYNMLMCDSVNASAVLIQYNTVPAMYSKY